MIKIKIKNATGKEETQFISKMLKYLDKETEITSTRANKTFLLTKEDLQIINEEKK